MKHPIAILIPLIAIGLLWLSLLPVPKSPAQINAEFEVFFRTAVKLPSVEYIQNIIKKTGKQPVVNKQFIEKMNSELPKQTVATKTAELNEISQFRYDRLSPCNKFRLLNLKSKLTDQLNVLETKHSDENFDAREDENIERKRLQQLRYMNKIKGYSGSNMTFDDLIKYGKSEVDKALKGLSTLETEIISQGLASSLDEFQTNYVNSFSREEDIIEAFNARRPIIEENLSKLFLEYDLPPTKIVASRKLDFVYAIGTYTPVRYIFHFYWDGESFLGKDLDYLMIHELVPGHHMQNVLIRRGTTCTGDKGLPNSPRSRYSRSFMEGWATYIEEFGPELGLFQTFEQRLGYWDWQLIRSHRVILDARLHHDNWLWEQFESYWIDHLPERLQNLAEREYKRLRRMPLQTHTYKFGADAILKLRNREEARLGDDFDIRKFHDKLLRMGQVPMDILEDSYAALP